MPKQQKKGGAALRLAVLLLCFTDRFGGLRLAVAAQHVDQLMAHHIAQRGTGIGLAVCEEIVTMHGGTLTLENAEGGGTLVTIALPAAQ